MEEKNQWNEIYSAKILHLYAVIMVRIGEPVACACPHYSFSAEESTQQETCGYSCSLGLHVWYCKDDLGDF